MGNAAIVVVVLLHEIARRTRNEIGDFLHIAYIPDGKVVGLSKLARVVDVYAKRLQLQERLNAQIADAIFDELNPKGVIVAIEAQHTCMSARGVKKIGAKTITFAKRGDVDESIERLILEGLK